MINHESTNKKQICVILIIILISFFFFLWGYIHPLKLFMEITDYHFFHVEYSLTRTLREKCPNTELFLVLIFQYSVRVPENTDQK